MNRSVVINAARKTASSGGSALRADGLGSTMTMTITLITTPMAGTG